MFLTIGLSSVYSQELKKNPTSIPAKTTKIATSKESKETLKVTDTIKLDSVKKNQKVFLDGIVKYKAQDYVKINQKKKLITLYNKAELYYTDVELKSGIIVMNYEKNEVYAGRLKDSTGKYIQYPNFKQGTNVVEPDSIRFNFKTKKALVWNSRTEQGEFKVKAGISKRVNDSVYFMKGARFTTAKDIDDPEYWFYTNRLKFVPGKKIVTGLTNMVIAGVPTPLALPFAFFPMGKEERNSGILIPTFADNATLGYSLQNGGYYFALSDSYDLAVTGDYFTNGGYAMRFNSSYANRYKFRGNLGFDFQNLISGESGFAGYSKTNIYHLNWSHAKDSKSNPNSSFSASVNLGSSKYFQQSLNQNNNQNRLVNSFSSSINYSKRFNTIPQVNLTLTATHSQNSQTGEILMTLPTLQVNVDRIFPFAKGNGLKKGFIDNINLQYTLSGKNEIKTTDEFFFTSQMFKTSENGLQHTIPLSTNFKVFKHFSVSTGASYNEVWYTKTIRKNYDNVKKEVVSTEVNDFDAFRTYSFNSSIGTVIYGTFKFGENKKIQAIQHVVTPSLSYSYTPSFERYYEKFTYQTDFNGIKSEEYTRFEKGVYGAPGKTYSNIIGFNLDNTFEAKVRDKDSTKTEAKKVKLLQLGFSTGYDITADSLKLAPVSMRGGTSFFNQKLSINFGASLDPYVVDVNGVRRNKYNIANHGSLFRMTQANLTMNYSLSSKELRGEKEKKKKNVNTNPQNQFGNPNDINNNQQSLFSKEDDEEEENKEKTKFFFSKIDWTLTLGYSFAYSNTKREESFPTNSLIVNANIDLTPKWKIGGSTGYDVKTNTLTYTNLRMERDLLSWRMSFNWVPFGQYTSWGFFIGIKSSTLSDIKWEKNKVPDRRF
jgi:LptD protein